MAWMMGKIRTRYRGWDQPQSSTHSPHSQPDSPSSAECPCSWSWAVSRVWQARVCDVSTREPASRRGPRLVLSPCQVSARVRSSNSLCSPSDIGPSSRPRSTTTSATLSVSPSSLSNLWIKTRGYLQIPGGQNLTLLVLELTFLLCKTKNGNFL